MRRSLAIRIISRVSSTGQYGNYMYLKNVFKTHRCWHADCYVGWLAIVRRTQFEIQKLHIVRFLVILKYFSNIHLKYFSVHVDILYLTTAK